MNWMVIWICCCVLFGIQITHGSILDLESILKQITPEADDPQNSLSKDTVRFRRNELPKILDISQEKRTEKRETDSEDSKRFSVVKLPDLMTAQEMNNTSQISQFISNNDESSGSGVSDEASESGSGEHEKPEGDKENEVRKKSFTERIKPNSASEATFISNIEETESGSGSGEASGSGLEDEPAEKRNLMENIKFQKKDKQVVSIHSPVSVSGNVSKVVMISPGGNTEQPMMKDEKKNVTTNHTLTEIKYFKEDNSTKVGDKSLSNNQENRTFSTALSSFANKEPEKAILNNDTRLVANFQAPSNLSIPSNISLLTNSSFVKLNETTKNETEVTAKKYSLPRTPEEIELSAEANKLFNFESETTGDTGKELLSPTNKTTAAESDDDSDDDSLPGGQGGPVGEDLMNASSNENKTVDKKSTESSPVKKWKVVEGDGNFVDQASGSGFSSDEIKMEVESTIGSSFDASMKKAAANGDGEILPGDYGDENSLPLSELSGSGSGGEESGNGDMNESGSGEAISDYQVIDPTASESTNEKLSNTTTADNQENDYSGKSDSGSGTESGSGSGETERNNVSEEEEEPENKHMQSPFGLSAIDAMSDGAKLSYVRNTSSQAPFNSSVNVGEGEEELQSTDNEEELPSEIASGSGEQEESGKTEESTSLNEGKEEGDEFEFPKKSTEADETGLAKDQVSRIDPSEDETVTEEPVESQTSNESNDETNDEEHVQDNEEATIEDEKPEMEEETTHKRHHHHHHRHHRHHHHHHKPEEESEGECTDRQSCATPAHNRYANPKVMPQQGDIVTEEFLEHLMVSQLLEQNVNLFYTNMAGRPGEQGDEGDKGPSGIRGEPGINGFPGSPGDSGSFGSAGEPGVKGIKGPPGFPGNKGDIGDAGESGLSGPPGSPGPPGPPGNSVFGGLDAEKFPNCSYACEGEKAWLQCQPYEVIKILRVFWGREEDQVTGQNVNICSNPPQGLRMTEACESDTGNAFNKVNSQCRLRQACELPASKIFFDDDSCQNTYKYLKVCYECMSDEANSVDILKLKRKRKKRKVKRNSENHHQNIFDNRDKRSIWDEESVWKHPLHRVRSSHL